MAFPFFSLLSILLTCLYLLEPQEPAYAMKSRSLPNGCWGGGSLFGADYCRNSGPICSLL